MIMAYGFLVNINNQTAQIQPVDEEDIVTVKGTPLEISELDSALEEAPEDPILVIYNKETLELEEL